VNEQLRGKALAAWLIVCVVWGSTYLAIRIGVAHLPPFLFAGVRFLIAGVLLAAGARLAGHRFPRARADWRRNAGVGLLLLGVGNIAVVWAEQFTASGLASVFVVTATTWTAAFDVLIPGGTTRCTPRLVSGLLLGLVGCVLLVGITPAELAAADWRGPAALTVGCIAWSLGSVWSKREPTEASPYAASAVQMLAAGTVLTLVGTLRGEWSRFVLDGPAIGALVYLIIFGSLVAFTAYMYALQHASATIVGTYAYVNPVVAVLLGRAFAGEAVTTRMLLGMTVIAGAVAWLQLGERRRAAI
jgi:drug/metabolite transporter (DMT)-like permease